MSEHLQHKESKNARTRLRELTPARVASETTGVSFTTHEVMRFREDFASTKDALAKSLDIKYIQDKIIAAGLEYIVLESQVENREQYLLRPDLGRMLNTESQNKLASLYNTKNSDLCFCVTDGLSAQAVNHQFIETIEFLLPQLRDATISISPVCLLENGRVAISDQIGALLHAKASVIFLGERPGLSSPESMGIYLTYGPKIGNTDANRNCISNIWKNGLKPEEAANRLFYLISNSLHNQISGVALKDNSPTPSQIHSPR